MADTNADINLRDKSPAELHDLGLAELAASMDYETDNARGSRKASTAIAFFFAALSADNLSIAASPRPAGGHRAPSDPEMPAIRPAEFTGHHG